MPRRVKDVLGKPVISADTGEKLGTVVDLLLDDASHALVGVVVGHGVLKHEEILPASSVHSFGFDAVVSRSAELIGAKEWRETHTESRPRR
jgi:uncharacterized protein YrrD